MGLIKVSEAAKRIGVDRQTLINWNKEGYLKFHYIGKGKKSPAFIDDNTFSNISDTIQEIEYAKSMLKQVLVDINTEYRKESSILRDIRRELYLIGKAGNSPFTKEFYLSIPIMLLSIGILNDREADIIRRIIVGEDIDYIANEYNLTRTRVMQIFYKGCRKAKNLLSIKQQIDTINELKEEIRVKSVEITELTQLLIDNNIDNILDDCKIRLLATPITDIDFSFRTKNCLKAAEVNTIGDLVKWRGIDLLKFRNFGKKSVQEIEEFLESKKLKLKDF